MSKESEFQSRIGAIDAEDSDAVGNLVTEIYGSNPLLDYFNSLDEEGKTEFLAQPQFQDSVTKFNPYHDELGRFTTGSGYAQGGYTVEQTYRQNQMKGKGFSLEAISNAMSQGYLGPESSVDQFKEVYGAKVNGTTSTGRKTTIASQIKSVVSEYGRVRVTGDLKDLTTGQKIGEIQRTFYKDDNGDICVEHDYLAIHHAFRSEYAHFGLGKKIIQQSEAHYVNIGVKAITVSTAWEGARHWARAGYDWDPKPVSMRSNYANLLKMAFNINGDTMGFPKPIVNKFNSFMKNMSPDYDPKNLYSLYDNRSTTKFHPITNDNFPIPNDFASLGYTKGARTWIGKSMLQDVMMKYRKEVSVAGYNIK